MNPATRILFRKQINLCNNALEKPLFLFLRQNKKEILVLLVHDIQCLVQTR
jgi:hypothetical protein